MEIRINTINEGLLTEQKRRVGKSKEKKEERGSFIGSLRLSGLVGCVWREEGICGLV